MEKVENLSFKGIYYAKSAIFANEIRKGVKPYLIDSHPDRYN